MRRKQPTPYMDGLRFTPGEAADPGRRVISDDQLERAKAEGEQSGGSSRGAATTASDWRLPMETRFKLLGHPVHPMLIVFPLGLFSTAVVFDIAYLITGNDDLAVFSFWAIAAGLAGGLAAAAFGIIDWLGLPEGTRAKRLARLHGAGNGGVLALFGVSWLLRVDDAAYLPNLLPVVSAVAGSGVSLFTAWLGGELVYRLRVAVDDAANLDASSSLAASGVAEARGPSDRA